MLEHALVRHNSSFRSLILTFCIIFGGKIQFYCPAEFILGLSGFIEIEEKLTAVELILWRRAYLLMPTFSL
jgi:hypothetical protein